VDFVFHIGFHKTASSWLQQTYFPAHPEVALLCNSLAAWEDSFLQYLVTTPDQKFSASKCLDILDRKLSEQPEHGDKRVFLVSAERLSGYPLSGGFDRIRLAERIHAIAPQARILVMVREQIGMIRSVYKQVVGEGYPGRFEDMLLNQRWKTAGFDLSYFEYDLLIEKYVKLFGQKNLLVLPYDLLLDDKAELTRRICGFFGISQLDAPNQEKLVNKSLPDKCLGLVRRLNYFKRSELNPFPLFHIPARARRAVIEQSINLIPESDSDSSYMTSEQIAWLEEYFEESNARLKELVGIRFVCRSGDEPGIGSEVKID
jgi:Sulfotransferase family